jgi:putative ABC transport system permease protein
MGCCLLISLWALDELNYDRFHAASDRLFRVESDEEYSGLARHAIATPIPLAYAMEQEIPEVEQASRFTRFGGLQLAVGDQSFFEGDVIAADPSFLRMFSFPLVEGSESSALAAPLSVLITERMAAKYFAQESPVGKTVRAENRFELTVTGILKNPPSNSSLQFDWIVPFAFVESRLSRMPDGWVNAVSTYTKLRPGAPPSEVSAKITALVARHLQNPAVKISYTVEPLTRIHLFFRTGRGLLAMNIYYVYVFSLIGLFVLAIACINFMNLSTARSAERAREIGLRKVVGARRGDLVRQFYGESLLYVLGATGLAFGMTALFLPTFNAVTQKALAARTLAGAGPLAAATGIALLTVIISGSYPSVFLSRLRPAGILRGSGAVTRRGTLRKVLVVVQFTLSITLMIGTSVVLRQTRFLKTKDVGFDRRELVLIPLRGGVAEAYPGLKAELARSSSVIGVTAMSRRPDMIGDYSRDVSWEGKESDQALRVCFAAVDFDFTGTVGLQLAAGRDFARERGGDLKNGFLVNEEMARRMGRPDVLGARLSMFGREGTVVGVLKDFHFQPLHERIEPLVLLPAPNADWLGNIVIRLRPGSTGRALDEIKAAWIKAAPAFPFEYAFLSEDFGRVYWREERMARLLEFFTTLAFLIAGLGLFGLSSFVAEQRAKEIGIRKVLGASIPKIVLSLSSEFVRLELIACLLAWPSAYVLARAWLAGFAYRIGPGFPWFILAGVAAVGIAFATVSYQSFKAARTDPVKALKYE